VGGKKKFERNRGSFSGKATAKVKVGGYSVRKEGVSGDQKTEFAGGREGARGGGGRKGYGEEPLYQPEVRKKKGIAKGGKSLKSEEQFWRSNLGAEEPGGDSAKASLI